MKANDFLEIFTLPFGYYLQNQFFEILVQTSIIYVPFIYIVVETIASAREKGLSGIEAVEAIMGAIETKFMKMILVIMVAVSPLTYGPTTTPANVEYQMHSCNERYRRVVLGADVESVQQAFTFTHNIQSHAPLAMGLANALSTAAANAVIGSIPCSIGYSDIQHIIGNAGLRVSSTQRLVDDFATQCYIPILQDVLANTDENFDPTSNTFIEEFGVLSDKMLAAYKGTDSQGEKTLNTKTSNWKEIPKESKVNSDTVTTTCSDAIAEIGTLIVKDPKFSESSQIMYGYQTNTYANNSSYNSQYIKNMQAYGNKDASYDAKGVDELEMRYINEVFRKTVGGAHVVQVAHSKEKELDWYDGGNLVDLVTSVAAIFGAWVISVVSGAAAQVAIDVIPWTISVFQGVIAAFGIIALFLSCYSGRTLFIILATMLILELTMVGLEFAVWVDNVAFTIINSKYAYFDDSLGRTKAVMFLFRAVLYIVVPMFLYKWLMQTGAESQAVGDLAPGATDAGRAGGFGIGLLARGGMNALKGSGSMMAKAIKKTNQRAATLEAARNGGGVRRPTPPRRNR